MQRGTNGERAESVQTMRRLFTTMAEVQFNRSRKSPNFFSSLATDNSTRWELEQVFSINKTAVQKCVQPLIATPSSDASSRRRSASAAPRTM